MAQGSDARAPELGLEILLVGSAGEASEVARALRDGGAGVQNVAPAEAAHAALVGAPDLIVLMHDAVTDGVLDALAARSATSVTPVVLVRDAASAPSDGSAQRGTGPIASVSHAAPAVLATRVLELASHLTTREAHPALRALFAAGRPPKKSGARVMVPSPSALESEGADTAKIATLPETDAPEPAPIAKRKIVPFVPTERYGAVEASIAAPAQREVAAPIVANVPPSRRRAVGRSMKIDKSPIEPATSIRPTEVDLLVVGASRAVSTERYERVTPRPAPRLYLAAALLAAIAILASAIALHASRTSEPTSIPLHASP